MARAGRFTPSGSANEIGIHDDSPPGCTVDTVMGGMCWKPREGGGDLERAHVRYPHARATALTGELEYRIMQIPFILFLIVESALDAATGRDPRRPPVSRRRSRAVV